MCYLVSLSNREVDRWQEKDNTTNDIDFRNTNDFDFKVHFPLDSGSYNLVNKPYVFH